VVTYLSSNTAVATIVGNTVTIVGAGSTTITASQASNTNYNAAADVPQPLTVTKAALTITADNKTRVQGLINPVLTASYSGFVSGNNSSALITLPSLSTTATAASVFGTYPIIIGGATAANYTITHTNGILTVTAPLNAAPTNMALSRSDINENNSVGAIIGTLSTTDLDVGDSFSYKLVSGTGSTDNSSFSILGNELRAATVFDFEVKASYLIRIRTTDNGGLGFERLFEININDVNEAPTLAVIPNQTICYSNSVQNLVLNGISPGTESGQTTTLTVGTSNSTLISGLRIIPGTGGTATLSYTPLNTAGGTASITVTVQDNGGTANGGNDTFVRSFILTINPAVSAKVTSDKGVLISKGDLVNLTASGGTSYQWANAAGIISGQNTSLLIVKPLVNTTYRVTVSNAQGCTSIQEISLSVLDDFETIQASNIVSPNGDGVNDFWVVKNIELYPNNEVKVFTASGNLVFSRKGYLNTWDATVNSSPLAEGTYYYIVDFGNKTRVFTGFITIVRQ